MSTSTLHTEIIGSGPPLVLMHGWGHSIEMVRGFGDVLSERYRVHMIDLPGFGESPPLHEEASRSDYVEEVAEYLERAAVKQAVIVGHSFGGSIAVELAAKYPQFASALVLINASGIPRKLDLPTKIRRKRIALYRSLIKAVDRVAGTELFRGWFSARYGSPDYQRAGVLRKTFVKVISTPVTEWARKIAVPTLLLWGECDPETPLDVARSYRDLIPGSALVVLPGKGHLPFSDMGAHLCAYQLYRFFERREAA